MSKLNIKPAITYGALVGHILQRWRQTLEVDQAQVANAMGLSRSAYSRVESGQTSISLAQLHKVAKALGQSPSSLLQQADGLELQLTKQGVAVVPEKEVSPGAALIGLGILVALLAQMAE